MNNQPTEHEIQVMEMMAGNRDWEYGAWVNACFEFLIEERYCTKFGKITDKGRKFLEKAE